MLQVVAALAALLPIAFGLIRAIQTGTDFRYVWVASVSLAGAASVIAFARLRRLKLATVSIGIFAIATACGMLMALLLGTRFNAGMLVVVSAFGFCFATAWTLHSWFRG
jgi:hypothetical protein